MVYVFTIWMTSYVYKESATSCAHVSISRHPFARERLLSGAAFGNRICKALMAFELLSVHTCVLVFQLQHEKAELEQHLEQEQEFQVNKLMKKIKKLENDTISKQLTLEQVSPGSLPAFSHRGGRHRGVGGRGLISALTMSLPVHPPSHISVLQELGRELLFHGRNVKFLSREAEGKGSNARMVSVSVLWQAYGDQSRCRESFRRNDGHLPTFLAL